MTDQVKQFKDYKNRWRTQTLVYELVVDKDSKHPYYYTVADKDRTLPDGTVLLSLKRLYLEISDPTEYEFATQVLGGWAHWQRFTVNKAMSKYIAEWREELEAKMKSKGVSALISLSTSDKGMQAAKYLAECGWKAKKAGRPSKAQIEAIAKKEAAVKKEHESDSDRIAHLFKG